MAGPNIPTRVMMFRDFVPDRIRVFLCLLFALIFQFSGGIYLSSVSQMVGSTALMQEDIMMAGYASFVGMTVVFPILFRLKFRFTTRSILLFICPSLILCNIITMYTESLPVLVIFCFIAGVLRMWGTFEALSNVQLSITPTRDFAVFFPVVYMIVLGSIQLSGLATVYLGYWANWKYMHLFIIGLLLIMWALVAMLTHHFRFMKPMPLFGIDWLGGALWSIFLLSLIFVFEYGKFYDWYDSWQIVIGTVIAVVSLAMSIHRMLVMRHPYIELEAFKYKNLSSLLFLFLILCFFLASPNVLQNIFTGSILKYDVLNSVSLNWWNFAGTVIGCIFAFVWHAKLHGRYKLPVFLGFALIVGYKCIMYFIIDPNMNIEWLYLPTMLRGAGYIILYISLTVYVTGIVPFQHFFQVLSILGFVRTGFGSVMGSAIYSRVMQYIVPENFQTISIELDSVNTAINGSSFVAVYGEAMKQTILVSLKEMYGWVCIVGVLFLALILFEKFLNRNIVGRLPRIRRIKQIMKRR
ncbi:hypothetical protein [Bacteroides caecigallinarum]|uniref:hypothetical protein n=1 Tax=Bacteroides caecigallinarum TaxID=1411144 RepID=UPI00195D160D|nr:hypothetical protein [Bacteroides caecigallinarum]MBM6883378.1 hypothetical protein [Bacteroides caecigallinarum]